jgi:hypothetical protein
MGDEKNVDAHSWPLVGVDDERRVRAQEQQFRQRLARWEAAWDAGDLGAPRRAMRALGRRPPPDWLVAAVDKLTVLAMSDEEKDQRRDWDNHQTRWEALVELQARKQELFERFEHQRGWSWERGRAVVARLLNCSEGTVKTSYEIVKSAGGENATFESYKALLRRRNEPPG